jgi:hypothetical protein
MAKLTASDAITHLRPLAENGKLILFAGSGVSVGSGLPTWDGFLKEFIEFCRDVQAHLPNDKKFSDLLNDAENRIQKDPTRVSSVLKDQLKKLELPEGGLSNVSDLFKQHFQRIFYSAAPNENHHHIVRTNYPYILTTNYDMLIEEAAKEEGLLELWKNSYSFNKPGRVAAAIYEERPSILHLHGNVLDIALTNALDEFVFTAEDYIRIKKKYSGFTLAVQTLFFKYSVLFVGYGGSDPHLEDFLEELSYYLDWPRYPDFPLRYFLVLSKDKADLVLEKYKDKLRTEVIAVDDFAQMTELLKTLEQISPRAGVVV